MKTIPLSVLEADSTQYKQIADTLAGGGLVGLPTSSGYKLVADLSSPAAITAMLHAKRRVKNAPALVFVPDVDWVDRVAAVVSDQARRLMRRFWPGPVTLLLKASDDLHPKVRKPLTKAKGWLGVRVPDDEVSLGVVRAFGRPVLVSSANLARKQGAHSVAQVKKNFGRTVELLVDAGDIRPSAGSTLVDVSGPGVSVVRAGAVTEDSIHEALVG
jgi:tRNA threonylcarbamoyl adenosine modification protein (Sua5/YciO/YrdC/YwlC family)